MDVSKLNLNLNDIFKKYVNNKTLCIIVIIGVVLMLMPQNGQKQKDNIDVIQYDNYSDEARLTEILSKVEGAGKVSVMITYYGSSTKDVAFEKRTSTQSSQDEESKSEENSAVHKDGSPLIVGQSYPKAKGVIIIAEGAESAEVRKNLTDAAAAVLDLAYCRVCVLEGKER